MIAFVNEAIYWMHRYMVVISRKKIAYCSILPSIYKMFQFSLYAFFARVSTQ